MDTILHTRFERMEVVVNSLVNSIVALNPSPQAALDLVAADDELNDGLDVLSQHQANYARILALRAEMEALEAQLKTSVGALANLRTELLEAPSAPFPEDSRPVPANEVLQYAMKISEHTVPPTYREQVPATGAEKDKENEDVASSGIPTNGVNTPANTNAADEEPKEGEGAEAQNEGAKEEAKWLKDLKELNNTGVKWFPWPSDDKIRMGNLGRIQLMLDQKKNPWTDKEPTMAELEAATKAQKKAEEEAQQQAANRAQAAQEPMPPRENAPQQAPRAEPEQVQQQFGGFEFDDDDY